VSNLPFTRDNSGKPGLIPDMTTPHGLVVESSGGGDELAAYQLVGGVWLTKATTGSRPERVVGHTGTETRPRLLREAAVGNIAQWAKA
jgi:hypothetical protein